MAITAAGIGSGLDIASIVNQLVTAERAPTANRIATERSRYNTQLSALGSLKGALSTLQSKADALVTGNTFNAFKVNSSLAEVFTATADADAVAGSYQIEVVALARAHKVVSDPYVNGAGAVIGSGDVEITVGSEAFTVTLVDGQNTLADLRDAINAASDNTGVGATLVNEQNGTRLLLTARQTGTDSQIAVNSTLLGVTENQAAADAHIRLDNLDIYSQSNTVSDAVDGVTFTLLQESPGASGTLTVSRDATAAQKAIEDLVKAYNTVSTLITSQTRYDADARRASTFTGDAAVRGVAQALRRIVGGAVEGGDLTALSELGITTKTDGTLEINSATLKEALDANPSGAATLIAGDNGIGRQLSSTIKQMLQDGGSLDSKTDTVNAHLKELTKRSDALDRRIESLEARYTAQFAALDSLIAQMNATSNYLSQQLSALTQQT